jgi:hypothetical protein
VTSPAAPSLDDALSALAAVAKGYPTRPATLAPDFVLYGLAMDVWEHATAVEQLIASPVPRAALANSRAALEPSVDLAFLVADETQYLYRAAQCRLAELFETDDIERRAAPLNPAYAPGAPTRLDVETVVAQDAADWDKRAPGTGANLRAAWEAFTKDRGALRKHWSLLTKEQVYSTVLDTPGDSTPLGQMGAVIHAVLSLSTHPSPRVGMRNVAHLPDGSMLLTTKPGDAGYASGVAALACVVATEALKKRRSFK